MTTKKKRNYAFYILYLLFLCFIVLYISKESGYYDYKAHVKKELTQEAIKQFERDVAEGKDVSIDDYAVITYTEYSNPISDIGYKTSDTLEKIMSKGIKGTFKIVSALFMN